MKSTIIFFAICFSISYMSFADRFVVMRDAGATSVDSIEFAINGRPVVASMLGVGSFGGVGPVSEWIKAGTNVLSITVAEKASDEVREKHSDLTDEKESARVKLVFRRYGDGNAGILKEQIVVDEIFNSIPTNFVFSVPDLWPIKKLVWEGETPMLTDKDKTEIRDILTSMSDAFTSLGEKDSISKIWAMEKYKNETLAPLNGMSFDDLKRHKDVSLPKLATRYSSRKVEFDDIDYHVVPGLNLVRVSVKTDNAQSGREPILAYREDGNGVMVGPQWFSKIDGKWWIVP